MIFLAQLAFLSHVQAESSDAKDQFERKMTNLLIRSAEAGNGNSQMELGQLYAIGDGVLKNYVYSYKIERILTNYCIYERKRNKTEDNQIREITEKLKEIWD